MAVSPATRPANMNARITAGPATGAASLSTKKMPVPIVAPMPNVESWNSPIERASSPPSVSAPVSAAITLTGLRRVTCCRSEGIAPPLEGDRPDALATGHGDATAAICGMHRAVPFAAVFAYEVDPAEAGAFEAVYGADGE